MKIRHLFLSLALIALSAAAVADSYAIDPVHASLVFRIKHLGVANFYGMFTEMSGAYDYDPEKPETNRVELTVKTASVSTANEARDKHLRSADFFDAEQHPEMRFVSREWKKTEDQHYEVTGDLTLLGVTKPVAAKVEFSGEGEGMKGEFRTGFEATFKIRRSEFGMTKYLPIVLGDEVRLILSVEGIRKDAASS